VVIPVTVEAAEVLKFSCGSEGCGKGNHETFVCASSARMKIHERTKKHQVNEEHDLTCLNRLDFISLSSLFVRITYSVPWA
jgi:hypothetical protein